MKGHENKPDGGSSQESMALLPCPFCGGTRVFLIDPPDWVECSDCKTEGPYRDSNRPNAVTAWNTRAGMPDPAAEIAALRSALAEEKAGREADREAVMERICTRGVHLMQTPMICDGCIVEQAREAEIAKLREALEAVAQIHRRYCDRVGVGDEWAKSVEAKVRAALAAIGAAP
jgi:Lar family restriction alleviation protein